MVNHKTAFVTNHRTDKRGDSATASRLATSSCKQKENAIKKTGSATDLGNGIRSPVIAILVFCYAIGMARRM